MRCAALDSTPPPPQIRCYQLNYNTFSDAVDDRYVVSNTIPKINITQNYRSWVGGGNYIRLYQAFAVPRNFTIDPATGLPPAADTNRLVVETAKIKRKYENEWIDFNQIWSGDWRLIQHDHAMAIAYQAGWFSNGITTIDYSVNAGVKIDTPDAATYLHSMLGLKYRVQ